MQWRHNNLLGSKSDVAPILWQNGAYARLKPNEVIDPLLFNDYSSISLGYAGLFECVKALTGKSHTEEKEFALSIMQKLNDKCNEWKANENIGYSVYGTPLESTTYKFAKALKVFPIIQDVNDRDYITNSYHISVREEINAFEKFDFEAPFQKLSAGGLDNHNSRKATLKVCEPCQGVCSIYYANGEHYIIGNSVSSC